MFRARDSRGGRILGDFHAGVVLGDSIVRLLESRSNEIRKVRRERLAVIFSAAPSETDAVDAISIPLTRRDSLTD